MMILNIMSYIARVPNEIIIIINKGDKTNYSHFHFKSLKTDLKSWTMMSVAYWNGDELSRYARVIIDGLQSIGLHARRTT